MILPVQLLHGLTFSLTWAAGVSYARQIAPAGMSATAQGLFSGTFFGLGGSVGALMGGILYQTVGSALMFRYVAMVIPSCGAVFLWTGRSSRSAASASG
jgi:predicted MFS family arabinose efflux permease